MGGKQLELTCKKDCVLLNAERMGPGSRVRAGEDVWGEQARGTEGDRLSEAR